MRCVLVVEDADAQRAMMERALAGAGYSVVAARDAREAYEAIASGRFVAAVVDHGIPGATGTEVLAHLRMAQPNCVRLLASGSLDVAVTMEAVNRGEIMRVLQKPYDGHALVDAVRSAITAHDERGKRYESTEDRLLLRALDACLHEGLLALAVQPIVDAKTRQIVAYEALLRSRHADLNTPLKVIEVAERHERVTELATIVAKLSEAWLHKIPASRKLFLNLHPKELGDPDGMRDRLRPLAPHADRVVFEITERADLRSVAHASMGLAVLRDYRFAIAVDDLGAGSSTLALLAEVKPQFIKIDMSLVRDVHRDGHKQRLVELLCRFGEATASTVVAEGVESEDEAAPLVGAGAHLLQGYLFARPSLSLPPG